MVWEPNPEKVSWWRAMEPSSRRWAIVVGCTVAIAVAAAGLYFGYPRVVQLRAEKKGRTFLEQEEYRAASVVAQRSLQMNPRSVNANRIMAEAMEGGGSSQALRWRRQVTELQPDVLENHLAWADTALRFHEPEMAEQALETVNDAGRKTAAYHEAAARVAYALQKPAQMESHFAEAVRLEPGNQKYQLSLAATRLLSKDPKVRDAARARIEEATANPALYRFASQMMIQDALSKSQTQSAVSLAEKLATAPDATFEDRTYYLALLRRVQSPKFASYLAILQDQVREQPARTAALMTWLNNNGMALISIDWSKRFPEAERAEFPVSAAIAGSYAALSEWKMVRDLIIGLDWKQFEYARWMLLARALREKGEDHEWKDRWNSAIKAAMNQPEAYAVLARNARAWAWESEATDLLWSAAERRSDQKWALKALERQYAAKRDTRALLRVASQVLKTDPHDLTAQHNVASLSCLLEINIEVAATLAAELYRKDPKNPAFGATQAFALYKKGETEQALETMRALGKERLQEPSYAAYYGVLLAAAGENSEAVKFLDIGSRANLLPEERTLVGQTREKLNVSSKVEAATQAQP